MEVILPDPLPEPPNTFIGLEQHITVWLVRVKSPKSDAFPTVEIST